MADRENLAKIFKALANPHRLAIFERLREADIRWRKGDDAPLCVCHVADGTGLALSTVSHHLKELRNAGLIRREKHGPWVYCSVNAAALTEVKVFFKAKVSRRERRRSRSR